MKKKISSQLNIDGISNDQQDYLHSAAKTEQRCFVRLNFSQRQIRTNKVAFEMPSSTERFSFHIRTNFTIKKIIRTERMQVVLNACQRNVLDSKMYFQSQTLGKNGKLSSTSKINAPEMSRQNEIIELTVLRYFLNLFP